MFTEIIHGYEIGKKECLRETIPSVVNGDRPQFGKVRLIRLVYFNFFKSKIHINCHLHQNSIHYVLFFKARTKQLGF